MRRKVFRTLVKKYGYLLDLFQWALYYFTNETVLATSRANWKNWSTFIQTPGPTANLPTYLCTRLQCSLSLSFSLNLSVNVISPSLSLSTILYCIRLSHFQFDRNFLSLSFVPPSHDTTFTTKALGSKWAPLSIQISFRKSSRGASPESTPPQGILFSLGKSMKKDRQRRRNRRRRYKNERNLVKVSRWSAANKRATFSSSSLLSFLKRFFWWKFASSTNFERRLMLVVVASKKAVLYF